MCGIAGVLTPRDSPPVDLSIVERVQGHRGPDGTGRQEFAYGDWRVAFSHQRLAIIDLSEAALQPMLDEAGNALIFNGEIYNYRELRTELGALGEAFRTESDTEVLLAALRVWGRDALARLNGMWAFAWFDRTRARLIMARDRLGIKPLYLLSSSNRLAFASEIKTLLALSGTRHDVYAPAVSSYLDQSLLDATNRTMFAGIEALQAGSYLELDLRESRKASTQVQYWTVPTASDGSAYRTPSEAAEVVRELFADSVRLRLRSDVPVGVLLSGGVDSSSIAAAAVTHLGPDANLHLLTAGSDGPADESYFAARVAGELGRDIDRVDLRFSPHEAVELLRRATWHNDEPLGSFTSVAHYLLMKAAADRGVTVILSGQGADELLCGYRKYLGFYLQQLLNDGDVVRAGVALARFVMNRSVVTQFSLAEGRRYLPKGLLPERPEVRSRALVSHAPTQLGIPRGMPVQVRQALDLTSLSVPQLLHYEDRMSMAWSREIRLPFLDHRLVEQLIPLATDMKLRDGWTKWIFRHAMDGSVPRQALWRRDKRGFDNPEADWLKNELREQVLTHFQEDALMFRFGLVDRKALLSTYEAYLHQPAKGGAIWFKDIFNSLSLELWLREFEPYLTGAVAAAPD